MSLPFFRRKNLSSRQSQARAAKKRPAFRLDPIVQLEERTVPATYTWDIAPGTVGAGNSTITGGAGTWNTINGNWTADAGANNVAWPAASTADDDAVFGGAPGIVSLASSLSVNDMAFNTSGYTINGSGTQTLTLDGTTPTVTVGAGLTATLNTSASNKATLAGSAGLTKAGPGTLTLRWSDNGAIDNGAFTTHTFTGGVVVNGGTLRTNIVSSTGTKTNFIAPGNSLTLAGATYTQNVGGDNMTLRQTFAGLTLNSGASAINMNLADGGSFNDLALGAITRNAGATLTVPTFTRISGGNPFTRITIGTTTANAGATGILGPWAFWGSGVATQYAFNTNVNNPIAGKNIGPLTGVSAATIAAMTDTTGLFNYDLSSNTSATAVDNFSANTVRYTGTGVTVTSSATGGMTLNGLLNAGTGTLTIQPTGSVGIGSTNELVVNTANSPIVISAPVSESATAALIKVGASDLTLGGTNTYTGNTFINQGNLVLSGTLGSGGVYNGVISGAGNFIKSGSTTQTLGGVNTHTGTTTVNGGTLIVSGSGSLAAASTVTVHSGATLGGSGAVNGAVSVLAGATLLPGGASNIGTLTIGSIAPLQGIVAAEINKAAGPTLTTDKIIVTSGALTLGGTLTVTATGDALVLGDSFDLFDAASFAGSFFTLNLPALDPGLTWDTSALSTTGVITVANLTVNPTITATLSSGALTIADAGSNVNRMTVSKVGANIVITDATQQFAAADAATIGGTLSNGNQTLTIPTGSVTVTSIAFNLGGSNDTLTVDATTALGVPISFDGSGDTGDGLRVVGSGTQTAVYKPNATTNGSGAVTVNSQPVNFTGLESIDVGVVSSAALNLPNAADLLTVANGVDFLGGSNTPALRVSGTSGGVGFTPVAFYSNTTFIIDTVAGGSDGNDTVTVTSASVGNNASVQINTGSGATDSVAVNSSAVTTGTLNVSTPNLTSAQFNATSGSWASGFATLTLPTHTFQAGQTVTVGNVSLNGYNGMFVLTGVTGTTITYALANNPGGNSTGGKVASTMISSGLTVTGAGTLNGVIAGTGGLTKLGSGTLTLVNDIPFGASDNNNTQTTSTFTGGVTVTGGTLRLQNSGSNKARTDYIPSSNSLTLNGATYNQANVNDNFAVKQTFNGLTLNGGGNQIILNLTDGSSDSDLAIGAITRNTGSTLTIPTFTTVNNQPISRITIGTSTANAGATGILGPWIFWGSGIATQYARNTGSATGTIAGNNIGGLTGTAAANGANDFTSNTANYDFSNTVPTTLDPGKTANTARYTGSGNTIDTNGNTLELNGLLNAGTGTLTVSGTGSVVIGSTNELVVNAASSPIVISAPVTESATAALIKIGASDLTLGGTSTYTGNTFINQGNLVLSGTLGSGSYSGVISGAGNLVKSGSTTQTLGGANTYTGTTTVNGGGTLIVSASIASTAALSVSGATLTVNGSVASPVTASSGATVNVGGAGTLNGSVTLTPGTTLSGSGTVSGAATVPVGANVIPGGNSIATLNFGTAPTLQGTIVAQIDRNGGTFLADKINLTAGVLTFGGTLTVANFGLAPVLNDTFNLFDAASFAGSFSSINLPVLSAGLSWVTSNLLVDGTISVSNVVAPASLTASLDGSGNLLVTEDAAFNGTGENNAMTISNDGSGNVVISDANEGFDPVAVALISGASLSNGNKTLIVPVSSITGTDITFNVGAGTDALTANVANALGKTIALTGGTGGALTTLRVIGSSTQAAVYTPNATTQGDGVVTVGSEAINFTGLDVSKPVDIGVMATATLNLPGAADLLTVVDGLDSLGGSALRVSGTSGGVAIESAAFFGNTTVAIDTVTGGSNGSDTITVTSATAGANTNLSISTGTGTDNVNINGAMTFAGSVAINTVNVTGVLAATITTGAAPGLSITNTNIGANTIAGIVAGAGGLTKAGAGTLTLSNASNSYTGGTNLNGGILSISADGQLGSTAATNPVTFNGGTLTRTAGTITTARGFVVSAGGGTVNLNNFNLVFGTANTLTGAGTLTLFNGNAGGGAFNATASQPNFNGGLIVDNGRLDGASATNIGSAGSGWATITLQNGGSIQNSGGGTWANNFRVSGVGEGASFGIFRNGYTINGTLTLIGNTTISGNAGISNTINGKISSTGTFTLTLNGTNGGNTVSLMNSSNDFTGTIIVNAGIIQIAADGSLGNAANAVTMNNASTLRAGAAGIALGASRTITLGAGTVIINTNGNNMAVNSTLTGSGSLAKVGAGALTLAATYNATGDVLVQGGTVVLGAANQIPDGVGKGVLQVVGGATLDLNGQTETVNGLFGGGTVTNNGTAATLSVGGADTTSVFSGVIQNGTGATSLEKIGSGTLSLAGNNTYTGTTTVTAGTFRLGGATAPAGTPLIRLDATQLSTLKQDSAGTVSVTTAGNPVGLWVDTTAGNDFGQPDNASRRPTYQTVGGINGLPVVRFDGDTATNDLLRSLANFNPGLVLIVNRATSLGGSDGIFGQHSSDAGIRANGGTWTNAGMNADTLLSLNGGAGTTSASTAGPQLLGITGSFMGSTTYSIGSYFGPDQRGMGGDIGEVIVYSPGYSTADRLMTELYLLSKWGLPGGVGALPASVIPDGSAVIVASGATLDLNGKSETIGSLAGIATGIVTSGSAGAITLTTGGDNTSTTFSGVIQDGTGPVAVTKTGTGVWTVEGTNTYTGATNVSAGTLLVNGSGSLDGASLVTVASNTDSATATLGGSGTINGAVSLSATAATDRVSRITGGEIGSIGTLNLTGGLSLDAGSVAYFDITSTVVKDFLNVTAGSVTVGSGSILQAPAGLASGTYALIGFTGSAPTIANFTLQDLNGFDAAPSYSLTITGNTVNLQVGASLAAPTVTSIVPVIGPTTGGTIVNIYGSNFVDITSVTFGNTVFAPVSFTLTGTTQITLTSPSNAGVPGTVDIVVSNAGGDGTLNGDSDFTYAKPAVTSVVVNGGPGVVLGGSAWSLAGQHSVVKQILVTFNQPVSVASNAFTVTPVPVNPAGGPGVVVVNGGAMPSSLAVTATVAATLSPSSYLVTFSGPGTHHGGIINSGVYDLTTIASLVTANGEAMASDHSSTFFAMFGNIEANNQYAGSTFTTPIPPGYSSGDGATTAFVDPGSLFRFSDTFGSNVTAPVGPPAYDIVFDYNLDGAIDPGDLFAFSDAFGIDWDF